MPQENKDPIAEYVAKNPGSSFRAAGHAVAGYHGVRDALRVAGTSPKGITSSVFKGAANRAGPLMAAGMAIDAASLATSKAARDKAVSDVESDSKKPAAIRSVKGFFSPVKTGYGITKQVQELMQSENDSLKSAERYSSMLDERIARKKKGKSALAYIEPPKYRKP
jgi:hypothetical protein